MKKMIIKVRRACFTIQQLIIMRTIDLLIYAIILTIGLCDVPNYQERAIYLGQSDNVCHFGHYSDQIRLIFNLDGKETRTIQVWGKTQCWQYEPTDAQRIFPRSYWTYSIEDRSDYFEFDDETKIQKSGNFVIRIIQKSVIRSPTMVGGKSYNCKILGDGVIKHFGVDFPAYDPAEFHISCTLRETQEQTTQAS